MIFRDNNGNIIEILKYDYVNDINYYTYIYKKIYNVDLNKNINEDKNIMNNIIKIIKNK